MGDVHACMGDGEIMVTGLEIPAEVTVTLEVLKGISIDNPMLEDGEACYTIASHENVETAVYTAVKAMTDILMRELGMSLEDAGMLLSAMGNLQFCQVVDPKRTVRMEMKKTVLKKLFLIFGRSYRPFYIGFLIWAAKRSGRLLSGLFCL